MDGEEGVWMGRRESREGGGSVDREKVEEKRRGQGRHNL